jgi:hypothetical protein
MKRLEREPGAPHLTFRVLALAQKQVAPGSGIPEVAASGIFTSDLLALRELTLPTYKLKRVSQREVLLLVVVPVQKSCKLPSKHRTAPAIHNGPAKARSLDQAPCARAANQGRAAKLCVHAGLARKL